MGCCRVVAVCLLLLWAGFVLPAKAEESVENARPRGRFPIPVKVVRYAQHVVQQHDADGDGRLDAAEWSVPDAELAEADLNKDGVIEVSEVAQRIARYGRRRRIRLMPAPVGGAIRIPSLLNPATEDEPAEGTAGVGAPGGSGDRVVNSHEPASLSSKAPRRRDLKFTVPGSRLPSGLPDWFLSRDRDGDAQLTLAEYAPEPTDSALREFARHDANGDGLLTPREVVRGPIPGSRAQAAEQRREESVPRGSGPEEGSEEGSEDAPAATAEEAAPTDGSESPTAGRRKTRSSRAKAGSTSRTQQ